MKQHLVFNDFDAFAESINQAKIEHSQVDSGSFYGELIQIGNGPVLLSNHKMNRLIIQCGEGIKEYTTFLILGDMKQEFVWRNNMLNGTSIGILKGGMDFKCILPHNFYAIPVSIKNSLLRELSMSMGFYNFMKDLDSYEIIKIERNKAVQLQHLIKYIINTKRVEESLLNAYLPKFIISILAAQVLSANMEKDFVSKNLILSKSQDFIFENLKNDFTLADLCLKVGTSQRNLRYIFKDHVGVSPSKYMKRIKLNAVRRAIKNNRANQSIKEIANEFGFWHSGQFASDYYSFFGELPSHSIRS